MVICDVKILIDCLFCRRGDQFIHLKVNIPKKINDRQKELLKEFEAEFESAGASEQKAGAGASAGEESSAWQRLKDFMKK